MLPLFYVVSMAVKKSPAPFPMHGMQVPQYMCHLREPMRAMLGQEALTLTQRQVMQQPTPAGQEQADATCMLVSGTVLMVGGGSIFDGRQRSSSVLRVEKVLAMRAGRLFN